MSEVTDKNENETDSFKDAPDFRGQRRNHVWAGLFVLAVGTLLLAKQSGVDFPFWFFSWPVLIIAIGLLKGIKTGFKPGGWLVIIAIGAVFLSDRLVPDMDIKRYAIPIIIMAVGFWIIVRPKTHHRNFQRCKAQQDRWNTMNGMQETPIPRDSSDFLDTTSVFGGIKKIVLSKDFKGGDIVNFMGGTEINLSQADINGKITIEATNIFGGTKLIIPSTWDVQSDVVTIFGGVDDKRQMTGESPDPRKIVHLSGTCLFGGIDIRSF